MRYVYPVKLKRDADGGYVVTCAEVPEAITEGDSREEALSEAADALAAALGGYVEARRPIPKPREARAGEAQVALPALIAAKLALYSAMREQRVSNVELARRLGVTETVVRRLVHPDHRSKIERVEEALAVLGKHLVVEAA